jgi:LacI family transcriptional regulator
MPQLTTTSAEDRVARRLNILLGLNYSIAFDRRAFDGIAALTNERDDIKLTEMTADSPVLDEVRASKADGLIVSRMYNSALSGLGIPAVCLCDVPNQAENEYVVAVDEGSIGSLAVRHFLDAGFEHFAVFARPDAHKELARRIQSFISEVQDAGRECVAGPCLPGCVPNSPSPTDDVEWKSIAGTWLGNLPKPLAVFAPYDSHARVAVNAAKSVGLRVPEDVAVLGVDDDDTYCMTTSPQLSSVITPGRQVGEEALRLLLKVLTGAQRVPQRTFVPAPGIVVRGSSSDFALQDAEVIAGVRYIRENIASGVTVDKVAEHLLLSRRTLERRFMMALKHTVQEEIRRAQVNRAKRLLIDTDLMYSEVARKSGLVWQQRLNRLIKLATGQTPAQFRRAARLYRQV